MLNKIIVTLALKLYRHGRRIDRLTLNICGLLMLGSIIAPHLPYNDFRDACPYLLWIGGVSGLALLQRLFTRAVLIVWILHQNMESRDRRHTLLRDPPFTRAILIFGTLLPVSLAMGLLLDIPKPQP